MFVSFWRGPAALCTEKFWCRDCEWVCVFLCFIVIDHHRTTQFRLWKLFSVYKLRVFYILQVRNKKIVNDGNAATILQYKYFRCSQSSSEQKHWFYGLYNFNIYMVSVKYEKSFLILVFRWCWRVVEALKKILMR